MIREVHLKNHLRDHLRINDPLPSTLFPRSLTRLMLAKPTPARRVLARVIQAQKSHQEDKQVTGGKTARGSVFRVGDVKNYRRKNIFVDIRDIQGGLGARRYNVIYYDSIDVDPGWSLPKFFFFCIDTDFMKHWSLNSWSIRNDQDIYLRCGGDSKRWYTNPKLPRERELSHLWPISFNRGQNCCNSQGCEGR